MIPEMSTSTFTTMDVIISLVGIASGILVLLAMLSGKRSDAMIAVFLATTVLTSLTGFLFPFPKLLPSHLVGVVSLVVLTIALLTLYVFRINKGWRPTYVVAAIRALYLNTFVGVVQAFQKFPPLQAFAPTQSETPFVIAQAVVLVAFLLLGGLAVQRFQP
jgi:hypothetical protein